MSLLTMVNNILRYVPLNAEVIKANLQDAYRQLASQEWNRLNLQRLISTVGLYSTGTVSVDAEGNVVGVGTAFTFAMVGRFMKVYYVDTFFEIESWTDGTHIKLKDWPGDVISGKTYSIFKTIYEIPSEMGLVYEMVYQTALVKKSQDYFNKIDPYRSSTGDSPIYWAYAGISSPSERVPNWDMEVSGNWVLLNSTIQQTSDQAYSPSYSYEITLDASGNEGGMYQTLTSYLTKGKIYNISAYFFGKDLAAGSFAIDFDNNTLTSRTYSNGSWTMISARGKYVGTNGQIVVKVTPTNILNANKIFYVDNVSIREDVKESLLVEFFPVPTSVVGVRAHGKYRINPLSDVNSPLLPEDLIEARALLSCFRMKDLQQPNQGWGAKVAEQVQFYDELLTTARDEDYQLGAFHDRVKDRMAEGGYPRDDNFALSHDID